VVRLIACRIDQQLSFAARHLFATIKAAFATSFSSLADWLSIIIAFWSTPLGRGRPTKIRPNNQFMDQFTDQLPNWYGLVTSLEAFLLVQTPSTLVHTTIILT
jgi:hypothetical protein